MRYDNDKHKKRRRRRKFSFQFPLFRKKINKRKRGSTSFNNQNESNWLKLNKDIYLIIINLDLK